MNKMTYSKPQFMPILLSETAGGNCAFTISHTQNVCPVDIPNTGYTIFNPGTCTYTPTDYEEDVGIGICYTEAGPGANVYGS